MASNKFRGGKPEGFEKVIFIPIFGPHTLVATALNESTGFLVSQVKC